MKARTTQIARFIDGTMGATLGVALVHGEIGIALMIVILYCAGLVAGIMHGVGGDS